MEWDEGNTLPPVKGLQVQVYEVGECADPTTRVRICGGDGPKTMDSETARVVSGGVGRIRKCFLP